MPPRSNTRRVTHRDRVLCPWPQSFEHGVQGLKAETVQSMGHGASWQARTRDMPRHFAPPKSGARRILLEPACTPPPHDRVQGLHPTNAETTQSTGHGIAGHFPVAISCGHAAPPRVALRTRLRYRFLVPPPHECEQGNHVPHALTMQSTGQLRALQVLDSRNAPQLFPKNSAGRIACRTRVWRPPPHFSEQCVHTEKLDTLQSRGHSAPPIEPQARVSVKAGHTDSPSSRDRT